MDNTTRTSPSATSTRVVDVLVPVALNDIVGEVLDLYDHDQQIVLVRSLAPARPRVRGDAGRLRQLLHNLLKNAIEAIREGQANGSVNSVTADALTVPTVPAVQFGVSRQLGQADFGRTR